jgi:transcription antitermination factor NusG
LTGSTSIYPWYALQVWSRQEQSIAASLTSKGFETFAPSYDSHRVISGRKRKVELALFPGYLFCRMDPNHRLPVITAPGVIAILGNRNQATPVPEEEVETIQRTVASGLRAKPFGAPGIGQRVRLEAGPLAGVEGVLVSQKGQSRLVVSVTLLNRAVAVEIDEEWVSIERQPAPANLSLTYGGREMKPARSLAAGASTA